MNTIKRNPPQGDGLRGACTSWYNTMAKQCSPIGLYHGDSTKLGEK